MKIQEFKKFCADKKIKEENLEQRYKELLNEQKKFSGMCYKPKYKMFSGAHCPVPGCGKKLKEIRVSPSTFIFECSCGYEYADYDSLSL